MEFMENQGRVCRLCGQMENIYVDIFGEEGNRRYLGFKIHSKINILIDEGDPLPKVICVQCLGKLEFVCDFQEECLRTQQLLRDQYNLPPLSNIVKPDDGLPHIICMRCLGTLEFLCDFYSKCHDAQKDFHSIAKIRNIEHAFKDKIESEEESDKENVLPFKRGKSKIKSLERADLQPSKIKEFEGSEILQNVEISNDLIVKINGSLIIDDLQISKCLEGIQESSKILKKNSEDLQKNSESISKKLKTNSGVGLGNITQKSIEYTYTNVVNDLKSKKNISENFQEKLETSMNSVVTQNIAHIVKDNTTIDTVSSNPNTKRELSLSFSRKPEHYEKKFNKCSKPSSFVTRRNKNPYQGCKAVDKYFTETSQYKLLSANEKKLHLNYTECTSYVKINEIAEQNNVTFEETATNTSGNASIIMPSKAETFRKEFRLENIMMVHDNDIVQAEEIALLTNFSQLSKPTKPQSLNSSQGKTDYPSLGDKAEPMPVDETLILEVLAQEENMKSTRKQLIVFEVQLPDKENSVLSKHPADFKRTSLECTYSEGKGAKISELITEKQKKEIEAHYWIDMTLVNKSKVNKNIIVLGKLKYQCKLCETIYPRLDKCQVHIWRHLDMKPYLCKVCDFSTLTVSNIRCHIRKSHLKIKPFKCHLCKKSYNSGTLLEEHLNVHTGARPYKCSHCKFASTSKQVLAHHILIHKSKKDIICDACGKAFYSKGRMRAHQIMHNKDQAYKCTLCSTYVLHKEALERHYINVHSKDHICKICNKAYKSRKALHNHESVHSDAKFKCPLCPNIYKSTHILKEHVLKHQGIRQYKCNSCDKSFAQQSHLAAHMAVHSNITYNCPGCKKGFNRHDNMKVHAKRCQKFLENPELHNLFKKRKISVSKNRTAKACINQEDNSIKKKKLVKSQRYALKKIDKSIKDI